MPLPETTRVSARRSATGHEAGSTSWSGASYRVSDEWLAICIIGGHLLPADAASKDATLRLYHLKRVAEPKK